MPIEKEIFTDMIVEGLTPDTSFLSESKDMSEFVENHTIHLAEAGVEPDVLLNNNVFPVPITSREDIPKELTLNTFDTKNTVVRNIEKIEASYNKTKSVVEGHKLALIRKESAFAAHSYCPASDGVDTPVLVASGAVGVHGYKTLCFADIVTMVTSFQKLDLTNGELIAVLNPQHMNDLMLEDSKLYKEMVTSKSVFGVKIYTFNQTPVFDPATKAKKAFGAAVADTDAVTSLVYAPRFVMRAGGAIEMFLKEKDPEARGDIFGFQHRFTALPLTGKYIGAIYSPKA